MWTPFHVVSVTYLHTVLLCALPPHLNGSTLSPRLKCIHVAICIVHSMLYYEGISSPISIKFNLLFFVNSVEV